MASQKIRIKLMSYDNEMLDAAAARIVETMQKAGAKISGPIPLPTEKEIVTILRSPHKYKDSRKQGLALPSLLPGKGWLPRKIC